MVRPCVRATFFFMAEPEMDARLTRVVGDVVARAVRMLHPTRIWLFGSQARGTSSRGSDVDLALEVPPSARQAWSRFVLDSAEDVPALVDLDLVDLGTCSPALAAEIASTGRIVYEKAS
jgi:predicted nucleotidyltransferase